MHTQQPGVAAGPLSHLGRLRSAATLDCSFLSFHFSHSLCRKQKLYTEKCKRTLRVIFGIGPSIWFAVTFAH